MHADDGLAKQ
jgi:hypothetical protein